MLVASPGNMLCCLWDDALHTHRAGSPTATESAGLHCTPDNTQEDGEAFVTLLLHTVQTSNDIYINRDVDHHHFLACIFFLTVQHYVLAENRQYEHVTSKKTKSQTSVVSPVYSSFQPMFLLDIINNSYCSPERFIKRSQFTCCPLNLIYIYRLLKMQQNKTSWSAQWSEHLNKSLLVELLPKMCHRGKKPIILKGHSV